MYLAMMPHKNPDTLKSISRSHLRSHFRSALASCIPSNTVVGQNYVEQEPTQWTSRCYLWSSIHWSSSCLDEEKFRSCTQFDYQDLNAIFLHIITTPTPVSRSSSPADTEAQLKLKLKSPNAKISPRPQQITSQKTRRLKRTGPCRSSSTERICVRRSILSSLDSIPSTSPSTQTIWSYIAAKQRSLHPSEGQCQWEGQYE